MAGRRAPLALLAAAILVTFVAAQLIFLAWAAALAALVWLSRDPGSRVAARAAMLCMAALVLVAIPFSGLAIGFRGRTLASFDGIGEDAVFVSLAIAAAPIAACVFLALAPIASRARQLARWAMVSFALVLATSLAVLSGEKIAGLIGVFGAGTLLLLVFAMGYALVESSPRVT